MSAELLESPHRVQNEYHGMPGISRSMLWTFMKGRRLYESTYVKSELERDETDSMRLGTAAHCLLLEPSEFETRFVVPPRDVLTSNGARAGNKWKAWSEEHPHLTILKEDQVEDAKRTVEAIRKCIGNLLDKAQPRCEETITWTETIEDLSVECRALPDILILADGISFVTDIKTTSDPSPENFRRVAKQCGYWLQDAHYSTGLEIAYGRPARFIFVVACTEKPYQVRVYEFSAADRDKARENRRNAIRELAACYQSGDWSDPYEGKIEELTLFL